MGLFLSQEQATQYYFQSTEFLIENFLNFLSTVEINPAEKKILDFASGYGRFARYFAAIFGEVTVSDVEEDMLEFCEKEFNTSSFLSTTENLKEISNRFDIVFCFSLFTHLDKYTWQKMFNQLFQLVNNNGYFVISTSGYKMYSQLTPSLYYSVSNDTYKFLQKLYPLNRLCGPFLLKIFKYYFKNSAKKFDKLSNFDPKKLEDKQADFTFMPGSETERLNVWKYGTTIISDSYIERIISNIKNIKKIKKFNMGEFDQYHDIYIFQKL
jgi:ubiquinone/menaquinone biosynthesis C-methylase UbiE